MNNQSTHEKIAIIGFSCLFPGATTPDEFWQHLVQGVNTTTPATESQFGADPALYFDPQRRTNDTTYSLRGGYIHAAIDEDSDLDRESAWSLYVSREGLRHSGYLNRNDVLGRCGLILGSLSFPTQESNAQIGPIYAPALEQAIAELTGMDDFRLPRRPAPTQFDPLPDPSTTVAQRLRLGRAAFCIDAACASSIYAIGLGAAYLLAGEADLMITGAVSAADPLFVNMGFTHFGAYPDQGESRPLDVRSEGLISGEGAGVVILKRYSDAVRDGDTVYAVIGGIGLSNDGRGKHPLTPNSEGQILAFKRAYAGGVDRQQVQYIECHASGTPRGDKTELSSMDMFFDGVPQPPLIGSVKANHGHLLTVAGLASVLKVILSMQHDLIPATIGVEQPMISQHFGAAQVVQQNTPWPGPAKTAGVNAFGFGGVSAHLVLQTPAAAGQPQASAQIQKSRLAIVGMDAQFGGCEGLEDFARTLYDGEQHFVPLPPKRWKGLADDAPPGAYIDSFEIDFLRFKFPPREDDQPTPQHLLLLKVADRAVADAGLSENSNVAVIVVLETELSLHQYRSRLDLTWQMKQSLAAHGYTVEGGTALEGIVKDAISPPAQVNQYTSYIGNIVSSRVSALWNFSGPAFTLSSGENSVYKALQVAQILLADDQLEAVVIGAVDLAGGVENIAIRREQHPLNSGTLTMSFDQKANGWQVGEGAGAVVVQRADRARPQHIYATIESVTVHPGLDANSVTATMQAALNEAGITAEAVGYVEASASGIAEQDAAEIAALTQVYRQQGDDLQTALGSVKANIGHTGAASGIASLIKTALCLQRRFIPATPAWTGPKQPDTWTGSAFYVPQESRTWFTAPGELRHAVVGGLGSDGTCAQVVLSDALRSQTTETGSAYLRHRGLYLFPADGQDRDTFLRRLQRIEQQIDSGDSLSTIAQRAYADFRSGRYAAVIVARDADTLRRELQLAYKGIPTAFETGEDWFTPAGSAFSPNPLGTTGGIAFVYPGAFNSYPGHGRDFLHLFPGAIDFAYSLGSDVSDQISEKLLYPRTLGTPDRTQVKAARSRLMNDQRAVMESGILFSALYTQVIRDVFRVRPDMTFGYSLGESSMLWAMRVWRDSEPARAIMKQSELFKSRLFGRKDAVREAWGLPEHADNDFWASYVLTASPAQVMEHLPHETRVYLTHINTPTEVVIAGDPAACERVIERIGCQSVRAPFETVIHNEAMLSEYDDFFRLYHRPVHPVEGNVTFYSAADYEPLRLDRDLLARSVARVSCKQVDFPRLLHRAYRDGARVFIELGPGSTCTRWINDTLRAEGHEHLAVAIDQLRLDDHTAVLKMLARLASHRVPLDLSPLYDEAEPVGAQKQLLRTITLGGEPVREVIVTEENRRRLGQQGSEQRRAEPVMEAAYTAATGDSDHSRLLQNRLSGLREMAAALQAQVAQPGSAVPVAAPAPAPAPRRAVPAAVPRYTPGPAVFDTERIDQFARGSIKACFGQEYAIYDDKRAPRIPNTDLMLVSRIVEVDAQRLVTKAGSRMVAEYDVPVDMWFYRDNPYPFTPYSMLMEMALQPCGFLSAFMGPTLDFADIDFYFRNLDGSGVLHREVDLRGRTLVNEVELLSSTILQGIIIQKYSFDMRLDGESFYTGSSTFGYFTLQALSSQAGLDRGKPPAKWHEANPAASLTRLPANRGQSARNGEVFGLPVGQLAFLDEVQVNLQGGDQGRGYVYASNLVRPSDWFFRCHFHQDPVMPGSLGLETVTQAIHAYALEAGLGRELKSPRFGLVEDHEMVWKYRGQVLSDSHQVDVEVQINEIERTGGEIIIRADASLWKNTLRIYEFKNVGVRITNTPDR